ncbi:MAG: reductive dehalogenase [Bacillota bacterium]|nr:reductive dehalogenase [Bacillota bacterium]
MKNARFTLKLDFKVKVVEQPVYSRPPYGIDSNLSRFDEREAAFYSSRFTDEMMGGQSWRDRMAFVAAEKMLKTASGYTQLDYALNEASWRSYHPYNQSSLMDWVDAPEIRKPIEKDLAERGCKWRGRAAQNSVIVKQVARYFGAAAVGVTALNESWFYSHDRDGLPILFSKQVEFPKINSKGRFIPSPSNRVVVMLVAQDRELARFSPSALAGTAVGHGYSKMAETVSKMAVFIRGLGYSAIPMGNDTSLSIPIAVDAGLGEPGRHGLLLNPEYGSLVRICKVLTDLPLETDRPITFGAAEICRNCTICADNCPARAISFDSDPTYETVCASNNKGIKRWPVNSWSCLKYWANNGTDCGICQAVCPFSRTTAVGLRLNDPQDWWNIQLDVTG